MFQGGYMGKVLRVNLTTKTVTVEDLPEKIARDYIGGAGFGVKYLFDEVPGDVDPLGPDNKLIFAPGPLSGTPAPCASRMAVTTKSPLTGAVGMSLSGGYFPVELKFAGYDVLIIEGQSKTPVYLHIKDDKVTIKNAAKLWGMDTQITQTIIKQDVNDQNTRIACIGQAGENQSKMAAIINERRAFGRKGVGAVMGSKNLKAIAIRGSQQVPLANPEAFETARKFMLGAMKQSPVLYPEFSKLGTPMVVDATSAMGIFPSENYRNTGEKDYSASIGVEASISRNKGNEHCYGCPVGCTQLKLAQGQSYEGGMSDPEYETYYSLGSVVGVESVDSIIYNDMLCDKYGLDTMSVGVTIALAMELFEQGMLTAADTNGLDLRFGNHQAVTQLIAEIAFRREGIGALLCDGSRIMAAKVGGDAEYFAMHIKGLELPAYDPRGAKAHGLNFATSYTGADHNRGYAFQEVFGIPVPNAYDRFAVAGKGWLTKWNQDIRCATTDCPTMCGFLMDMALPAVAEQNTADLVSSASGVALTKEDVGRVGERVNNLARVFNISAGFTRADDTFPKRLMEETIKAGGSSGQRISEADLEQMLNEYYEARNWSPDGVPSREKLAELDLPEAAVLLAARGLLADD
jgi:aldehyde:ferredoxin oxidoreductase